MRIGDVIAIGALVIIVLVGGIAGANIFDWVGSVADQEWHDPPDPPSALPLAAIGIIIAASVGVLALVIGAFPGPPVTYRDEEEIEAETEPTLVEAETWTCQYCGQINDWNNKRCVICGAPRKVR